jgi:alkanesulfonate monooxygenase SsuD/methylene tetrahydromethanopterin reductase-like flavin-dependent oxidoreductase (luciferase family)
VGDAYRHSTKLAQLGEELGFERYWVALDREIAADLDVHLILYHSLLHTN